MKNLIMNNFKFLRIAKKIVASEIEDLYKFFDFLQDEFQFDSNTIKKEFESVMQTIKENHKEAILDDIVKDLFNFEMKDIEEIKRNLKEWKSNNDANILQKKFERTLKDKFQGIFDCYMQLNQKCFNNIARDFYVNGDFNQFNDKNFLDKFTSKLIPKPKEDFPEKEEIENDCSNYIDLITNKFKTNCFDSINIDTTTFENICNNQLKMKTNGIIYIEDSDPIINNYNNAIDSMEKSIVNQIDKIKFNDYSFNKFPENIKNSVDGFECYYKKICEIFGKYGTYYIKDSEKDMNNLREIINCSTEIKNILNNISTEINNYNCDTIITDSSVNSDSNCQKYFNQWKTYCIKLINDYLNKIPSVAKTAFSHLKPRKINFIANKIVKDFCVKNKIAAIKECVDGTNYFIDSDYAIQFSNDIMEIKQQMIDKFHELTQNYLIVIEGTKTQHYIADAEIAINKGENALSDLLNNSNNFKKLISSSKLLNQKSGGDYKREQQQTNINSNPAPSPTSSPLSLSGKPGKRKTIKLKQIANDFISTHAGTEKNGRYDFNDNIEIGNTNDYIFDKTGKSSVPFGTIKGNFVCKTDKVRTLENFPVIVSGNYICRDKSSINISVGLPDIVIGNFSLENDNLASIKEFASMTSVGNLLLAGNNITINDNLVDDINRIRFNNLVLPGNFNSFSREKQINLKTNYNVQEETNYFILTKK